MELGHRKYVIFYKLYVCKFAYSKNLHLWIHVVTIIFMNDSNTCFNITTILETNHIIVSARNFKMRNSSGEIEIYWDLD